MFVVGWRAGSGRGSVAQVGGRRARRRVATLCEIDVDWSCGAHSFLCTAYVIGFKTNIFDIVFDFVVYLFVFIDNKLFSRSFVFIYTFIQLFIDTNNNIT